MGFSALSREVLNDAVALIELDIVIEFPFEDAIAEGVDVLHEAVLVGGTDGLPFGGADAGEVFGRTDTLETKEDVVAVGHEIDRLRLALAVAPPTRGLVVCVVEGFLLRQRDRADLEGLATGAAA